MRKFLLGALLPLLMLSSCSSNDEREQSNIETGSLRFQTKVITDGIQVMPTRVTDYVDLYLYMKHVDSDMPFIDWRSLSEFPNMYINNIPAGDYEIVISSQVFYTHGYIPEFDTPLYEGRTYIHVSANTHQDVKIDCIQKNAGIRFIYDDSLEPAGFWHMFPVVRQFDGMQLEYAGDNKYRTGYFSQGDVAISFTGNDGALYLIGDEKEKVLTLDSEQLWEITLRADMNSIMMYVTVMAVNEPTHYEMFTVSRYH